jgi:phosphopantothenoylcysteine decarboxylase/phosphopantothenate--cysteine ligase
MGADVTLISGPVALAAPLGVTLKRVETAQDMLKATEDALPADIAIFSAAVADWRVSHAADEKLKKRDDGSTPTLSFTENPDILRTIATRKSKRPGVIIGFAAETEHVIDHAKAKLAKKGCDLIVANDVSPESGVFGGDRNRVHLVSGKGVETWPDMSKAEVASRLMQHVVSLL